MGFPGVSVVKNPPAAAGDMSSVPRSGSSPEEGDGNPLQYSCLGNRMDRDPPRGHKELDVTEQLRTHTRRVQTTSCKRKLLS